MREFAVLLAANILKITHRHRHVLRHRHTIDMSFKSSKVFYNIAAPAVSVAIRIHKD